VNGRGASTPRLNAASGHRRGRGEV